LVAFFYVQDERYTAGAMDGGSGDTGLTPPRVGAGGFVAGALRAPLTAGPIPQNMFAFHQGMV